MAEKERRPRKTFMYEGKKYEATGKTKEEAIANAALMKDRMKRGEIGISGNMTVKRWAEEWLETYKRPAIGDGQYKRYLTHIYGIIIPAIGNLRIKDVKDVHLQRILNGRQGKSKSDILKLNIALKAMFKQAYLSRLTAYNPAENLIAPAAKAGTNRSITEYEREKILELAETHYAGLWIKMMLYCGLRPGETRALDWRHINFERKLIHIRQAMKASTTNIDMPKSEAGIRDVPIPDKFLPSLTTDRKGPFEPVFTQPTTGKRHTAKSMDCLWRSFKRELDILMGAKVYRNQIKINVVAPDLVPYCLRHTYCTDLQDKGVPINVAKYLMGHSNIAVTAKIYTHTTDTAIQNAAALINRDKNLKVENIVDNA